MLDMKDWKDITDEEVGVYLSDEKDSINASSFDDAVDVRYSYKVGVQHRDNWDYMGKEDVMPELKKLKRGILASSGRGAYNGLVNFVEGVGSAAVRGAELGLQTAIETMDEPGALRYEDRKRFSEAANAINNKWKNWINTYTLAADEKDNQIAYNIANAGTNALGSIGMFALTRSPAAASALWGVSSAGQYVDELRQQGVDIYEAVGVGAPLGATIGAMERIGVAPFSKAFGARILGQHLAKKQVARFLAKSALSEGEEELLQQGLEESVMTYLGYRRQDKEQYPNEWSKVWDIAKNSLEAGAYGAIGGLFGGAVVTPALMQNKQQIKENLLNQGLDEEKADKLAELSVFNPEEAARDAANFMNKEADQNTLTNGSYEDDVKRFRDGLFENQYGKEFDIQEELKEQFMSNGVNEQDAQDAAVLETAFAKTMYNLTGETPRERMEREVLHIVDERGQELKDIDESELTPEELERLAEEERRLEREAIQAEGTIQTAVTEEEDIPFQTDIIRPWDTEHRGRGYIGQSMSVNMAEAQAQNRLPATSAGKALGVSPQAIREVLTSDEWHHTGSYYNQTPVYDINAYLDLKNGKELSTDEYTPEEILEIKSNWEKIKSYKQPAKEVKQYYGNVKWIEWEGTKQRPKAVEHSENNILIEEKGSFYTFHLPDGTTVKKKIGSNGTSVISEEEAQARVQRTANREARIKELQSEINMLHDKHKSEYDTYAKENKLDKPDFETFNKFDTETNASRDNFYIRGQKPTTAQRDKGLRRIHKENGKYQLQEWNGENWDTLETQDNFNESNTDKESPKRFYDFMGKDTERYNELSNELYDLENSGVFYQTDDVNTPEFKKWSENLPVISSEKADTYNTGKGGVFELYHGTPNADLEVLRGGTYFTPNKEYAKVYTEQSASYLSYKKEARQPGVLHVYVKMKKPFDTRNKEAREDFYKYYYQQMGMGTDLQESGLPDWMDGESLFKFITEYHPELGYDGVILDEGGTGGYGMEVKKRGISFIPVSSNQIKAVNNIGSFSSTSDNIYYQFAGQKSQTAALDKLQTAQRWEENGISEDEIRQKTGWFKGVDGKWRYEISDKDAKINQKALDLLKDDEHEFDLTVGDLLEHDRLFEAYPELADVKIEKTSREDIGGSYAGDVIKLNLKNASENLKSVLMHEIQHYIQHKEGFASGGSALTFFDKENMQIFRRLFKEQDTKKYKKAVMDDLYSKVDEEDATAILDADDAFLEACKLYDDIEEDGEALKKAESAFENTAAKLDEVIRNSGLTPEQYAQIKADAREKAGLDAFGRSKKAEQYNPFDLYKALYGEIEARNTQARMDMTDEERQAIAPESTQDIANAEAIVVFDDGSTAAYSTRQYFQSPTIRRGSYEPSKNLITLFKDANPTTLVHELGHRFTMEYVRTLEQLGKTEELKGFYDWLGIENINQADYETWEKMARGFETYVMEGVAPNVSTESLFTRLKKWMSEVYRDVVGKIIPPEEINDDVRAFFDKMLASEKVDIDISHIKGKTDELVKIINSALKGEQVSIDGLSMKDVKDLLKAANARLPRMPKTLRQAIRQAGGIDIQLAKSLGLYDSKKGNMSGFFKEDGTFDEEDSLIGFLQSEGFLNVSESESYEQTAEIQDKAISLLENADNVYSERDMETIYEREALQEAAEEANKLLAGVPYEDVQKALKTLSKQNIAGVQKDTLRYIKARLKKINSDFKKVLNSSLRNQKKDIASKQKEIIDYIKAQPISNDHKFRLVNEVKKANSDVALEKAIKEVKRRASDFYTQEQKTLLTAQIRKEIKKSKPTDVKKQRYDYETNKLFNDLRKYNGLTQIEAETELANFVNVEEPNNTDLIKMRYLNYKANGMNSSVELMEQVLNDILQAKQLGTMAKDEAELTAKINREELKQDVISAVDKNTADKDSLKTKIGNLYRRGMTNLYSMINSISSKALADRFEMETVCNKADVRYYKHTDALTKRVMALFGLNSRGDLLNKFSDMGQKLGQLYTIDGTNKRYDITKFEIMDMYNAVKNEKTRNNYNRVYGEEQVLRFINMLSSEERTFADMLMDDVNTLYPETNAVYVRTYGMDLKKVENYWPATSENVKETDLLAGYYVQQETPSFFKERIPGAVTPLAKNAWDKYLKHINESIYMIEVAEKYKELADTFKSNRVRNHIENKYGKDVYAQLLRQIDNLSLGKKGESLNYIESALGSIFNNFVVAKIAIAPTVFAGQLTAITNYSESVNTVDFYKNFAYGLAHPKETIKFMKDNAGAFLETRYAGGYNEALSRVQREAESSGKRKYKILSDKAKYNVTNALTSFVRLGDLGSLIFGGYASIQCNLKSGMPLKEAMHKFEFETLRSQQSSNAASLSAFQQATGFSRVLLAFKNTAHQYFRKISDSIINYSRGEISANDCAKIILNYAVVQGSLYVLAKNLVKAAMGYGNDDDELTDGLLEQFLCGNLDAIPLWSDLAHYTYKLSAGEYPGTLFSIPGLQDLEKSIRKLYKENKDVYDWVEIIAPFIEGTTSIPVTRYERIIKKYTEE